MVKLSGGGKIPPRIKANEFLKFNTDKFHSLTNDDENVFPLQIYQGVVFFLLSFILTYALYYLL